MINSNFSANNETTFNPTLFIQQNLGNTNFKNLQYGSSQINKNQKLSNYQTTKQTTEKQTDLTNPPKLKFFFAKALINCNSFKQKQQMTEKIKELIRIATINNQLWSIDWINYPIPQIEKDMKGLRINEQNTMTISGYGLTSHTIQTNTDNKQDPISQPTFLHFERKRNNNIIQNSSNSFGMNINSSDEDYKKRRTNPNFQVSINKTELNEKNNNNMNMKNKKKKNKKKKNNLPNKKLQDRAKRFEKDTSLTNKKLFLRNSKTEAVIGTSTSLEKQYLRITSEVNSSDVRPYEILKKSFQMIMDKWNNEHDYNYCCEQLKSIRQDLTVQVIRDEFTVQVYQTHSRLALENGDLGEFNQCQTQLVELFEQGIRPNIHEFIAYRILYYIVVNNSRGVIKVLKGLSSYDLQEFTIRHAIDVYLSITSGNYFNFFRLYKNVPNKGNYLMKHLIEKQRIIAIQNMLKVYLPEISLEYISKILAFNNTENCRLFMNKNFKIVYSKKDRFSIDTRKTKLNIKK
ncbi:leukocyte receptor cluster member 8 [Anaeramoeba flamelloides]|uniref:Leukocyte receptor cluster member 8 n=1 Tax=Anaeramoeba flamelloides TaxID=1746091 RepID=A0ABQ8YRD1_9EUKA|nr:leukocyte receptor cluster member 8 [Anaeramoeba flamelloides]